MSATVLATDLERPESDTRQYRLIKLPNGISVLLISDPSIGGGEAGAAREPVSCWPCSRQATATDDEANDDEAAATKKAACALSVGVGYLSDPSELQGCAHYVEHMLFMGTRKYPKENGWSTFLSRHGGLEVVALPARLEDGPPEGRGVEHQEEGRDPHERIHLD